MITTKRTMNGNYKILQDGVQVGEAWKYPNISGFGMNLNGIYWRYGEGDDAVPSRISGGTTIGRPRLKDLIVLADVVLALDLPKPPKKLEHDECWKCAGVLVTAGQPTWSTNPDDFCNTISAIIKCDSCGAEWQTSFRLEVLEVRKVEQNERS
jgi:hypothetical protein